MKSVFYTRIYHLYLPNLDLVREGTQRLNPQTSPRGSFLISKSTYDGQKNAKTVSSMNRRETRDDRYQLLVAPYLGHVDTQSAMLKVLKPTFLGWSLVQHSTQRELHQDESCNSKQVKTGFQVSCESMVRVAQDCRDLESFTSIGTKSTNAIELIHWRERRGGGCACENGKVSKEKQTLNRSVECLISYRCFWAHSKAPSSFSMAS